MLVWNDLSAAQRALCSAVSNARLDQGSVYGGYLSVVSRVILRDQERCEFAPSKLSAAMIGAFKAMGGRIQECIETRYAQWQQYVVCALQAVERRSGGSLARPLPIAPTRAVRRVKAFFMSLKVNGRNTP